MLAWLAANAATILISAALIVVLGLILRGMLRGRIKTCGDCGACGGASACSACQHRERCHN